VKQFLCLLLDWALCAGLVACGIYLERGSFWPVVALFVWGVFQMAARFAMADSGRRGHAD
jgi:hypothetical protein